MQPDKLPVNAKGTVVLVAPADTSEVKLPATTSEMLKSAPLEVKAGSITLDIPAVLIKQLESKVAVGERAGSTISLKLEKLDSSDAAALASKAGKVEKATVNKLGDIYEFNFSVTSASGQVSKLTTFSEPMTISFKLPEGKGNKSYGVYYIADSGKLEYVGGKIQNDEIVTTLHHFSKYAVMELLKSFSDVSSTYWAHDIISELAGKQIINGTSSSTFDPKRSITRAEFVSMLVNGLQLETAGSTTFKDVPATAWYADAVGKAFAAGIVTGKSGSLFDPNGLITREEMVSLMMKAYGLKNGKTPAAILTDSFTDYRKIAPWAAAAIGQAAELGLIQGRSGGQFDPQGLSTRAEAAQVLYTLIMK